MFKIQFQWIFNKGIFSPHQINQLYSNIILTMHDPLFWHGLESHSFISVWQFVPTYPGGHVHWYESGITLVHWALFWHGAWWLQTSWSSVHNEPPYPVSQIQSSGCTQCPCEAATLISKSKRLLYNFVSVMKFLYLH